MLLHNLKVAVRNMVKYKLQTSVSILSISLGMVFFALSSLWIRYELSYDSFHRDVDNTYLLMTLPDYLSDEDQSRVYSSYPEAPYLSDKFPQIEEITRCGSDGVAKVFKDDKVVAEMKGLTIDSTFQHFFDVKVLEGARELNLFGNEIAISEDYAVKLFDGNAVGNMLFTNQGVFYIKAVIENAKEPTSFYYDYLKAYDLEKYNNRGYISSLTFLRVRPENVYLLSREMANDTLIINRTGYYDGMSYTVTQKEINKYRLLPIKQIRKEGLVNQVLVEVNYLYLFLLLSIIMICSSLFNYFTMLVTRISVRLRELTIRQVNGASRFQLTCLFSTDILIILSLALLLGAVICLFSLPYFTRICGIDRPNSFFMLSYFLYAVAVGFLSILITSVIVAFTNRRKMSRSLNRNTGDSPSLRGYRISIGLQLAISIAAIFCSTVMYKQLKFLVESPEMGFKIQNIGVIYQHGFNENDIEAVRSELKKMPEIEQVVYSYIYPVPGGYNIHGTVKTEGDNPISVKASVVYASKEYFDLLQIKLIAGELLKNGDDNSVFINETTAKMLGGIDQAVGKNLYCYTDKRTITGVVNDLCYQTPTAENSPLIFIYRPEKIDVGPNADSYYIFSYKEKVEWEDLRAKIQKMVEKYRPDAYLHYTNAEESYKQFISSELSLCYFLIVVSGICVFIAICGVFSIVSLACEHRRKEIAVRKINGAKVATITKMFVKEYVLTLLASAAVAFPLSYYVMHLWLIQYIKQVPVTIWVFISILLSMALLIMVTVFSHIWKASRENPAEIIKGG